MTSPIDTLVFGSVALDVLCYPVDEVPRHDCIGFQQSAVAPGGCASNVAVGLSALGLRVALAARIGSDDSAGLIERFWQQRGIDTGYIQRQPGATAVSIGLVDSSGQPRFIHSSGSSSDLTVEDVNVEDAARRGARSLHLSGFFVLPGLMDGRLPALLARARRLGLLTSLDVVNSPPMEDPGPLWPCLPHLDYMLCNANEARRLTGHNQPLEAAQALLSGGAGTVLVKVGEEGVWAASTAFTGLVPAPQAQVFDTTGAGDAFAAGFLAATLKGAPLPEACRQGNAAGARMVSVLGAVAGWDRE